MGPELKKNYLFLYLCRWGKAFMYHVEFREVGGKLVGIGSLPPCAFQGWNSVHQSGQ